PDHGTVTNEAGGFRFTPEHDYLGQESFTYRPFDGTAYGDAALVTIGVIATNATPKALDTSLTFQPNSSNAFKLSGLDPDGDKIVYSLLTMPLHGVLRGEPPSMVYTPATNYLGPDRFTFRV